VTNAQVKRAIDKQSDGRAQSINVKLAPLSVSIMKFIPYTESELAKVIEERIRRNTPIKKSGKKTT
jgi:1,4-alpha-glucan branching enzyme